MEDAGPDDVDLGLGCQVTQPLGLVQILSYGALSLCPDELCRQQVCIYKPATLVSSSSGMSQAALQVDSCGMMEFYALQVVLACLHICVESAS